MDEKELLELYDLIADGYDNNDWNTILEAKEFLSEFIEIDDDED